MIDVDAEIAGDPMGRTGFLGVALQKGKSGATLLRFGRFAGTPGIAMVESPAGADAHGLKAPSHNEPVRAQWSAAWIEGSRVVAAPLTPLPASNVEEPVYGCIDTLGNPSLLLVVETPDRSLRALTLVAVDSSPTHELAILRFDVVKGAPHIVTEARIPIRSMAEGPMIASAAAEGQSGHWNVALAASVKGGLRILRLELDPAHWDAVVSQSADVLAVGSLPGQSLTIDDKSAVNLVARRVDGTLIRILWDRGVPESIPIQGVGPGITRVFLTMVPRSGIRWTFVREERMLLDEEGHELRAYDPGEPIRFLRGYGRLIDTHAWPSLNLER